MSHKNNLKNKSQLWIILFLFLILANVFNNYIKTKDVSSDNNILNSKDDKSFYEYDYSNDFTTSRSSNLEKTNGTGWGFGELKSNAKIIEEKSEFNSDLPISKIVVDNNEIIGLTGNDGLILINTSTIESSEIVDKLYNNINATDDIVVDGKDIYCADKNDGIEIFTFDNNQYKYSKNIFYKNSILEIEKVGPYIFCIAENDGLIIFKNNFNSEINIISSFNTLNIIEQLDHNNGIFSYYDKTENRINFFTFHEDLGINLIGHYYIDNLIDYILLNNHLIFLDSNNGLGVLKIEENNIKLKKKVNLDYPLLSIDNSNTDLYIGTSQGLYFLKFHSDYSFFPYFSKSVHSYDYIEIDNHLLYSVDKDSKTIYYSEIKVRSSFKHLNSIQNDYYISDFEIFDDKLILTYEDTLGFSTGWQIYNISDVFNPILLHTYSDIYNNYKDIELYGTLAIFCDYSDGIEIFNISDYNEPIKIGSYFDSFNYAESCTIWGNILFIADGSDGLNILNISDPTSPELISKFDDGGWTYSVEIYNNIAYIADGYHGIELVNISDIENPILITKYGDDYNNTRDLEVTKDYIFSADRYDGVEILNNSNPIEITEIQEIFYDNPLTESVEINGDLLIISDGVEGAEILNISNIYNINLIDKINNGNNETTSTLIFNNEIFIADGQFGLEIHSFYKSLGEEHLKESQFYSLSINNISSNVKNASVIYYGEISQNTSIKFEFSNNGTNDWKSCGNNSWINFDIQNWNLFFRIILYTENISESSIISKIKLKYYVENLPPTILSRSKLQNYSFWIQYEDFEEFSFDLSNFCTDSETINEELRWGISYYSTGLISIKIDPNNKHLIHIKSNENIFGNGMIILNLYDEKNSFDTIILNFSIIPINDPPIIDLSKINYNLNYERGKLYIDLTECIYDIDGDNLKISIFMGYNNNYDLISANKTDLTYIFDIKNFNNENYSLKVIVNDSEYSVIGVYDKQIFINKPDDSLIPTFMIYIVILFGIFTISIFFYFYFYRNNNRIVKNNVYSNYKFEKMNEKIKNTIHNFKIQIINFLFKGKKNNFDELDNTESNSNLAKDSLKFDDIFDEEDIFDL